MEFKTPGAILDIQLDWSDWLPAGDTIATSTWTVEAGITQDSESETTTTATIVLSGGTAGITYKLENFITTAAALQTSRIVFVRVQNRLT